MTEPTVARRLERCLILMTTDHAFEARVRALLPAEWSLRCTDDLDALGEWSDVLLYRFMLLDLDEVEAFDPPEVIRALRMEYQINLAVFCFGGDEALRDEMRLLRADRFFDRDELIDKLPLFLEHYGWGE